MTISYIVWPRAFVVHVGDSRCYLLRNGELAQVTVDHTMAAMNTSVAESSSEAICVVVNATTDAFTIYLTANATAAVKVAWHVFG